MDEDEAIDEAVLAPGAVRTRLRSVAADLERFLQGSEDVFLDAGRRVAGLEQRARALVDGARAAGAFRTASGTEDPADTLGRELSRMDDHLRGSRDGVAEAARQLGALAAELELLLRSQSNFESMPPTLRMLGLNTRIENARSDAQYPGMETVALEVRRLGDEVEPKFRSVFQRAGALLRTVRTALDTAEAFLHGQNASCVGIVGQTRGALESLRAMTAAGAAVADRALAASEQLTRDLGALLVSLQGHDATRQAVEHVVAELAEVEAEAARGGEAAAPPRMGEVARLLEAQVRGARERFLASLDGLGRSLRALSGVGADLSRETARFAGSGSGEAATLLVRQGVDRATHCLLQHVAHEAETAHSMERVVGTVQEMGGAVKDILGIGGAVKIIALNALVETERAGQGGRVLAVLAQGIGALAGEVVQRTGEVSRSLGEISGLASRLHHAATQGGAAEGEAIAGELEHLSVRLSEIQRGLEGAVRTMHEGSRALGEEVEGLSTRLAEAAGTTARLEEAERALGALAGAVGPPRPAEDDAGTRAYARYTMASERAIHDRVVNGVVREAEDDGPARGGADGLGANVELF